LRADRIEKDVGKPPNAPNPNDIKTVSTLLRDEFRGTELEDNSLVATEVAARAKAKVRANPGISTFNEAVRLTVAEMKLEGELQAEVNRFSANKIKLVSGGKSPESPITAEKGKTRYITNRYYKFPNLPATYRWNGVTMEEVPKASGRIRAANPGGGGGGYIPPEDEEEDN